MNLKSMSHIIFCPDMMHDSRYSTLWRKVMSDISEEVDNARASMGSPSRPYRLVQWEGTLFCFSLSSPYDVHLTTRDAFAYAGSKGVFFLRLFIPYPRYIKEHSAAERFSDYSNPQVLLRSSHTFRNYFYLQWTSSAEVAPTLPTCLLQLSSSPVSICSPPSETSCLLVT